MKHIRTALLSLTVLLAFSIVFTSCGSAGKDMALMEDIGYATNTDNQYTTNELYDGAIAEDSASGSSADVELYKTETTSEEVGSVTDNRKIIVRNELSVQTKEFDNLMDRIHAKVAELGGYVESATVNGQAMDSRSTRSANLVIRIPANADEEFTTFVSENSVIVRRAVDTEDVTLQYVDMESRLSTLRAEKEALEKLMEQANSMDDIILITDKLTQVIQEIESYQSRLRIYDNLIDYCTVTLYVDEVEYTTPVEKQSAFRTIGNNLKKNFASMWDGVVGVFVFLVSIIPYLIPFAVIGLIIFLFIRQSVRKRRKRLAKEKQIEENNEA